MEKTLLDLERRIQRSLASAGMDKREYQEYKKCISEVDLDFESADNQELQFLYWKIMYSLMLSNSTDGPDGKTVSFDSKVLDIRYLAFINASISKSSMEIPLVFDRLLEACCGQAETFDAVTREFAMTTLKYFAKCTTTEENSLVRCSSLIQSLSFEVFMPRSLISNICDTFGICVNTVKCSDILTELYQNICNSSLIRSKFMLLREFFINSNGCGVAIDEKLLDQLVHDIIICENSIGYHAGKLLETIAKNRPLTVNQILLKVFELADRSSLDCLSSIYANFISITFFQNPRLLQSILDDVIGEYRKFSSFYYMVLMGLAALNFHIPSYKLQESDLNSLIMLSTSDYSFVRELALKFIAIWRDIKLQKRLDLCRDILKADEQSSLQKTKLTHVLPNLLKMLTPLKILNNDEIVNFLSDIMGYCLRSLDDSNGLMRNYKLSLLKSFYCFSVTLNYSDVMANLLKETRLMMTELLISRSEFERKCSFDTLMIFNDKKCDGRILISHLANAPSYNTADGYSNALICSTETHTRILIFKELSRILIEQNRQRHEVITEKYSDTLGLYGLDTIEKSPVFPAALGLVKLKQSFLSKQELLSLDNKIFTDLVDACKQSLEDALHFFEALYRMEVTGSLPHRFDDNNNNDDDGDEDEDEDHKEISDPSFVLGRLQRCYWRTIKHTADLCVIIMKIREQFPMEVFIMTIGEYMCKLQNNWGAVKSLCDTYEMCLKHIERQSSSSILDDLIIWALEVINDETKCYQFRRLDDKNIGIAFLFIGILRQSVKKQRSRANVLMTYLFEYFDSTVERMQYNAACIIWFMLRDAKMAALLMDTNWIYKIILKVWDIVKGGNELSKRVHCVIISLYISGFQRVLGDSNKYGISELGQFRPHLFSIMKQQLLEASQIVDYHANSILFVLLSLFGEMKYCSSSGDESIKELLKSLLVCRHWYIRNAAAKAYTKCSKIEIDEIIITLQKSISQNEINGNLLLLNHLKSSNRSRRVDLTETHLKVEKWHPVNREQWKQLKYA